MKNVVIISSSLRNGSNSEILAKSFLEGIKEKYHVEFITLKGMNLNFCKGCLSCQNTGKCIINDDVCKYLDVISNADILVFFTPIYYYGMSGQLKTLLDRLNPLYIKENKFKEIYLIATCADSEPSSIDKTIVSLSGWIECFDGVEFKGSYLATSTNEVNSVKESDKIAVYQLAKSL
ncbi:MAG: flavodoxin family protein [Bacilli bacterium]